MNLPVSAPPSPRPGSAEGSDEDQPYLSPMDLINDNLLHAAHRNTTNGSSSSSGAGLSLVSRMQALHGLANRRRPGERTRSRRTAFFRDSAPLAPPSPSPRRERLRSLGSTSSTSPAGASSSSSLTLLTSTGSGTYLAHGTHANSNLASRPIRARHHSFSSASALDLQGVQCAGGVLSSQPSQMSGGGSGVPFPADSASTTAGSAGVPPPSSPASDTSGSTLSNSFMSLSQPIPTAHTSHMGGSLHPHLHSLNTNVYLQSSGAPPSFHPQVSQLLRSRSIRPLILTERTRRLSFSLKADSLCL